MHISEGESFHWVYVTHGSEDSGDDSAIISERESQIKKVGALYHFHEVHELCFPTTELDSIQKNKIISKISKIFKNIDMKGFSIEEKDKAIDFLKSA